MKKLFYLSAATVLLFFPSVAHAEYSSELTPNEVFCSNTSAKNGNALREINLMLNSRSKRLSPEEKQVLKDMAEILDRNDTIKSVCSPVEF